MNRLSRAQRADILHCLVEGVSIAATSRLTETAPLTITRLQTQAGVACTGFHDVFVRGLRCPRIQCDELWSFIYAKDRQKWNLSASAPDVTGTIWTWIAMCSETRLIISWGIGDRSTETALDLIRDVKRRVILNEKGGIQIATDGHYAYTEAIPKVFRGRVDHAQLIKTYSTKGDRNERRNGDHYPHTLGLVRRSLLTGEPEPDVDPNPVATSYVERLNLSIRMGLRRYTRRTNGFSRRLENHAQAVALYITYYNFARIHESLGKDMSPAMKAGLTNRLFNIQDIVRVLEEYDSEPGPRGPYRKTRERLATEAEVSVKKRKKRKGKKHKRKKAKNEDLVGVDYFENMGRSPRTKVAAKGRCAPNAPSHVLARSRQRKLMQQLEER